MQIELFDYGEYSLLLLLFIFTMIVVVVQQSTQIDFSRGKKAPDQNHSIQNMYEMKMQEKKEHKTWMVDRILFDKQIDAIPTADASR